MITFLKSALRAELGGYHAWKEHLRLKKTRRSISEALDYLGGRWPDASASPSTADPVFLISAGWRAGSTLVQRLLVSGGEILMWGEPYRNCGYVQMLGGALRSLSDTHPRPDEDLGDRGPSELVNQFIATLSPGVADLRDAHIAFFERLFQEPALRKGFQRWGLKETRFWPEHAAYLKWLFPRSKIIFLYRNPFKSYRSYRHFPTFYLTWPDQPVLSARQFGEIWRTQVSGILSSPVENVTISLEELTANPVETTERLSAFVGSKLDPEILNIHISGRGEDGRKKEPPAPVPWPERRALARVVGPLAEELGYGVDGNS